MERVRLIKKVKPFQGKKKELFPAPNIGDEVTIPMRSGEQWIQIRGIIFKIDWIIPGTMGVLAVKDSHKKVYTSLWSAKDGVHYGPMKGEQH